MKRSQPLLLFFVAVLISPAVAHAQAWSGIIDPARATDWTHAGVTGGIPSRGWPQCVTAACAKVTANGHSSTAAQINAAIVSAPNNTYVLLPPGTYNLSSGLCISRGNVVLRGAGANSTFLLFSAGASCGSYNPPLGIAGSTVQAVSTTPINWTAGYARETTEISLANTTGIGANSTVVVVDQCTDGLNGSPCAPSTGMTQIDNGNYWACEFPYHPGPRAYGCAQNGPNGGNERRNRPLTESFQVSAVNSGTGVVTLIGSLRNPDWSSGQTPQAWIYQPVQYSGFENFSVDASRFSNSTTIQLVASANCWVTGVRVIKPDYAGIQIAESVHDTIESNYSSGTIRAPGTDSYFLSMVLTSDNLIDNNIQHGAKGFAIFDGPDSGSVIAYNFDMNNYQANDSLQPPIFPHAINTWELFEGNIMGSYAGENIHGPKLMNTVYRNAYFGWESCGSGNCASPGVPVWSSTTTYNTFFGDPVAYPSATSGFYYVNYRGSGNLRNVPGASTCGGNPCWIVLSKSQALFSLMLAPYSRYHNVVGNILGTPGVSSSNTEIIGAGTGSTPPPDAIVGQTLYRWGNWDSGSNLVLWCGNSSDTDWSSPTGCNSTSQVPATFSPYPQPLPTIGDTGAGMASLGTVPSFYLPAKPSYWGSNPWPAIGPDVTNGNVGQCSGTQNAIGEFAGVAALNTAQCTGTSLTTPAWGGHINANPAMNCALNVMGMPPDGTGGVLSFNASACYGGSSSSVGPKPPTNLVVVPN
jgi:hypothetical protein